MRILALPTSWPIGKVLHLVSRSASVEPPQLYQALRSISKGLSGVRLVSAVLIIPTINPILSTKFTYLSGMKGVTDGTRTRALRSHNPLSLVPMGCPLLQNQLI
jgi:hypothetical protein